MFTVGATQRHMVHVLHFSRGDACEGITSPYCFQKQVVAPSKSFQLAAMALIVKHMTAKHI